MKLAHVARPWFRVFATRAVVAILVFTVSGCGLFYENHCSGDGFVVYSDRSPQFVARVGEEVQLITDGFSRVFDMPRKDLGSLTIVLHGMDSNIVDYSHSPDLLGYYIPVINYISVDTSPVWSGSDDLIGQVLLHEVAHHFIISLYSKASDECWLNEGLAGAFETTLYDQERMECPLFNPVLYQVASQAFRTADEPPDLHHLIHQSWSEFHSDSAKEQNYALGWSAVYFVLQHHFSQDESLASRIRRLCNMDRDRIVELQDAWTLFLRDFDDTSYFLGLVDGQAGELTANWAIHQLGMSRAGDDRKALRALTSFFSDDDPIKRGIAYVAFLTRLERSPFSFVMDDPWIRKNIEQIKDALHQGTDSVEIRIRLIQFMGRSIVYRADWIPVLIAMLERPEGPVRVAAAASLTQLASKPTIINPQFWRDASPERRSEEAAEWRRWWVTERRAAALVP